LKAAREEKHQLREEKNQLRENQKQLREKEKELRAEKAPPAAGVSRLSQYAGVRCRVHWWRPRTWAWFRWLSVCVPASCWAFGLLALLALLGGAACWRCLLLVGACLLQLLAAVAYFFVSSFCFL
jgi:hypothetical protein